MKSIKTLPQDIHNLFATGVKEEDKVFDDFGREMAELMKRRLSPDEVAKENSSLRMSNFGTPCTRKLWYTVNKSELAEPIPPKTKFKFLYGDIIEALTLFLAKLSGHKVEGEQEQVKVNGVVGHRDAVIDGVLVDVKSANSRGMQKFRYHKLETDDDFGYLDQLGLYLEASQSDPLVAVKKEAAFVAVDKEMGDIVVDIYKKPDKNYEEEVEDKKAMLANPEPPKRRYMPEVDGSSGNMKLPFQCSYCQFKHTCWQDSNGGKGLRGFFYSNGPRWLTKVVREPNVDEIGPGKRSLEEAAKDDT